MMFLFLKENLKNSLAKGPKNKFIFLFIEKDFDDRVLSLR